MLLHFGMSCGSLEGRGRVINRHNLLIQVQGHQDEQEGRAGRISPERFLSQLLTWPIWPNRKTGVASPLNGKIRSLQANG